MADIGEPTRRHKVIPLDQPIRETPEEPVAPPLPDRRTPVPSPSPDLEPVR
jgi:hypothetical protein